MRVLVTGATERYGYAAARALDDADVDVTAFVRDPDTPAAPALAERGIDIVRGRRDQLDHVEDALVDADGVFLAVGTGSARAATDQGETLVRAADRTDTPAVHASVLHADDRPGVRCVDVRASVDADLSSRGVPHVSLRAGVPLDAFERARDAVEAEGQLAFPLEGHARAALTDPRDVGRAAAAVFTTAGGPSGADRLPVTSGTHSLYDVADVLETVTGRDVRADPQPPTAAPRSQTAFYRWVNEGALLGAASDALADAYGVETAPIADYFERTDWGE
ncbi:NmrA family NAD(P)-binding protein [Halarchaeum sp. P4]|uniref:NmrA family NAD(P)-binding protein n=1 Tax=Halarchaeum sp. P4 TaxID=3421639 RepID=UPI003EBFA047